MKKLIVITAVVSMMASLAPGLQLTNKAEAASATSVASGNWSNSAIWSTGQVPGSLDNVTIDTNHIVTYDKSISKIAGMTINAGATLKFDPNKTATLETDKNVIVHGTFQMKPSSVSITHFLKFINVDETQFVGGGMEVLDSDVGLWVRGAGKLDLLGASKAGWTRLTGSASQGTTTITVQDATGWRVGDEISIVPTEHPNVGSRSYDGFENRIIESISGNTITLNSSLSHDHPKVNNKWTAEVMNLTRNVKIEGTGNNSPIPEENGRAHINIHSTTTQTISYAQVRHMGPRCYCDSRDPTGNVLGRYPIHFHHSADNSRGSMIEGTVVRNFGSHAYVPHASHGITIKDSIAYNGWEDAFWWDPPEGGDEPGSRRSDTHNNSHDTLFDHNIAAIVKDDPSSRGYTVSGFTLMAGQRNKLINSVSVGVQGNKDASGFHWPSQANQQEHNVWVFEDNISHNNKEQGIFVWQNDSNQHIVRRYEGYRNGGSGIDHGAYGNSYQYIDIELFQNGNYGIEQHALSNRSYRDDGYALTFERVTSDRLLHIGRHNLPGEAPVLYKDCSSPGVTINNNVGNKANPGEYDFVNCGLEPSDFTFESFIAGSRIRVQRADGTAYQIDDNQQVSTIPAFYDTNSSDTTAPTISLSSPSNGATISGTTTISATASDDVAVQKVDFYINGQYAGTDTTSPYEYSWDTAGTFDGTHYLKARATDTSGNSKTTSKLPVSVQNNNDEASPLSNPFLRFDGISDYINLNTLDIPIESSSGSASAVTMEAWARPKSLSSCTGMGCAIISKSSGSDNYWLLSALSDGKARFDIKTSSGTSSLTSSSAVFTPNTWTHIAAVYDGGQMKIYKDGIVAGTLSKSGSITTSSSVPTKVGSNASTSSNYFNGDIDEVRLWNTALSEQDISTQRLIDVSSSSANLFAYYSMNEGFGQTVNDESANSTNGTLGSTSSSDSNDPKWIPETSSDTTAPQISDVQALDITTTAATISWTTDEPSDSQVEFGTTTSYGTTTPIDNNLTTNHLINLSNLTPGTSYHYRVKSKDSSGNLAVGTDKMFTTVENDTTPPEISGISVSNITDTSATVSWNTSEKADAQVEFGTTSSLGNSTPVVDESTQSHTINLQSLQSDTTYHYRVKSKDSSSNLAVSDIQTFITLASAPPPSGDSPLDSSHLSFDGTDDRVTLPNLDISGSALSLEAWVRSEDLANCSARDCRIISKATDTGEQDHYWMISTRSSNTDTVLRFRLKTGGATTTLIASSGPISNNTWTHVAATYDGSQMKLYKDGELVGSTSKSGTIDTNSTVPAWIGANPDSSNFWQGQIDDVRIWNIARTQTQIQNAMNSELAGTETGLFAYYKFNEGTGQTVGDSSGNSNDGTLGSSSATESTDPAWVVPADTTPPVISNVTATNIAQTTATITWTTDEESDSEVRFDTVSCTASTCPHSSGIDSTMVTNHSVNLSSLQAETTYHYVVISKDAAGNTAESSTKSFTTLSDSVPKESFLVFDGFNDRATLPNLDVSGSALTLEAWMRSDNLANCNSSDCRIISKATGASEQDHYWMISTIEAGGEPRLRFRLKTGGATTTLIASSGVLSTNMWTHVAATYDGSHMKLYKDGELVGTSTKTGTISTNSTVPVWIGDNPPSDGNRPWDGSIDDVRIWNIARTQTQIQNAMNSELAGTETGLFAYYKFNEGTGQTVGDSSGNSNDGTLGSSSATESTDPAWSGSSSTEDDTTAPTLSNVAESNITETSATITWNTDEPADSQVEFGTTTSYGSTTTLNTTLSTSHSHELTGLSAGTTYNYKVKSRDAAGNLSVSVNKTFTTQEAADTTAPGEITTLGITDPTETSLKLNWTAVGDDGTTGTASGYEIKQSTQAPSGASTWWDNATLLSGAPTPQLSGSAESYTAVGLTEDTTYYFAVRAKDEKGNVSPLSLSSIKSGTTLAPQDTTAPTLSNIAESNITETSATITWNTDEPADSQVEFGTTTSLGTNTPLVTTLGTSHSINLSSLQADTTYYYQVKSKDAAGNLAASSIKSFKTSPVQDGSPLTISNVQAVSDSATSVIVTWQTNKPADSMVEYGLSPTSLTSAKSSSSLVTSHSITLSNLEKKTTYYYKVKSTDTSGNTAESDIHSFNSHPGKVKNLQAEQGSVLLTWEASGDPTVTSILVHRTTTGEIPDPSSTANRIAVITDTTQMQYKDVNVEKGVKYYYYIFTLNIDGSYSDPETITFTPAGQKASVTDTSSPIPPTSFEAFFGNAQISLSWVNPDDEDFVRVVLVRKEGSYPASPTDGTIVYEGTEETYTDTGLTNGTTHYYSLFAYDKVPNYSAPIRVKAVPEDIGETTASISASNILKDGDIVKTVNSFNVFEIRNGKLHRIPDIATLFARMHSFEKIKTASQEELNAIGSSFEFLPEGSLVRATGTEDVYIIKYIGIKQYKRLILSPHVFESYGHLRWEDIQDVSRATVDAFPTSNLVRAENDPRIFLLIPNGDTGTRRWISTADAFSRSGYDWDAVYTINDLDRDAYQEGQSLE